MMILSNFFLTPWGLDLKRERKNNSALLPFLSCGPYKYTLDTHNFNPPPSLSPTLAQ